MALVLNLARIAHEHTWRGRMYAMVSTVAVGCVSAGVAALSLSMISVPVTPEMELLLAAISGSMGKGGFDHLSEKLFARYVGKL